ncbi:hypothetical protein CFS9_40240 [Flavobacterium sp. CFS9]|uniref:Uncharacterized protein n=1 Tax=Flavobacterium sp. CFS9 TaxID=3143118 RepID=A0AAT9H770_9FLAO
MNDFDPKYSIRISFKQPLEGLQLVLVDGTLNKIVEEETQQLELSLVKGIYQLKASFIDYFEEYFLNVSQDEHFVLDYHYPMTSPSMEFATTHEYFSNPAEMWSRKCTYNDKNQIPNFFFFAAAYDRDFPNKEQTVTNLLTNFSLYDPNGKLYIRFRDKNSFIDPDAAVMVFSAQLNNGMYFLQYEKEKERRIFPFYIYDRFQTQFLLRYKQTPDFSNSFFYYDNKFGFNRTDHQYLLLDKIQYAYKDYSNYKLLTPSDRSAIKKHPYLVALLIILHIATENQQDSKEFTGSQILFLPDIAILTALKDSKQQINSDELPIVSAIMAKCMVTAGKKMEFRPGSIMDRVLDTLSFDIFWNNFSAVEDLSLMEKLYNDLLDKSKLYGKNLKRKAAQIITNSIAPELLKEEHLNSLLGNTPTDTSESDTKFIEAINSVGNVSQISNKLNLPPTTVLRNYEKYDDIYKKMNLK